MPGIVAILGLFSTLWTIKKVGKFWEPNNLINHSYVNKVIYDDPYIRLTFIH